ncbi:MAG: hypothetical protein QNK37_12450 [Acidobacteriota bacterium]|nr:hypothetical protein [Acidobacteriota bacterium]
MLLMLSILLGLGNGVDTYSFCPKAGEFLDLFFPLETLPSIQTNSYVWGKNIPPVETYVELPRQNFLATEPASDAGKEVLRMDSHSIDSYWSVSLVSVERAVQFVTWCKKKDALALIDDLSYSEWHFSSVLEKSLFQRDVYQVFCLLDRLEGYGAGIDQPYLNSLKEALKLVFHRALLSKSEYDQLMEHRPSKLNRTFFRSRLDEESPKLYLPEPVYGRTAGWNEIDYSKSATKHFITYEGRSFIKVLVKTPGISQREFLEYRKRVFSKYGQNVTISSNVEPLPANTETLLLRTFGVFLTDGRYADSHLPESVTMRIFRYETQRLDRKTSDFRGTDILSYSMSRENLMKRPGSLGLAEDELDAPTFLGFFKSAPDHGNSYSDALATVRYNCIGCHSELHYGAATVFSLAKDPTMHYPRGNHLYNEMLVRTEEKNFFLLETRAFTNIFFDD